MVQCERLLNYGAIRAAGFPPGAFSWTQTYSNPGVITHLSICVPLPTTGWDPGERLRVLRVYRTGEARPEAETAWEWDGNLDKPTINPSIGVTLNRVDDRSNRVDEGYAFHGWLKGGVLESV